MATITSSSDAREKAGETGEQTQPKRGLRGSLASASERVRRAIAGGREKSEAPPATPAAVTGTHPVLQPQLGADTATVDEARASVRALARSLLHHDRTGEPMEPSGVAESEVAESEVAELEAEEPKTVPRAKSVPPPLPKQRVSEEVADAAELTASDTPLEAELNAAPQVAAPSPALSSRSALLRARLDAAKAKLARAQARAAEQAQAADAAAVIESADASEEAQNADTASAAAPDTAAETLDASDATPDEVDEFEDLEAASLIKDPAPAPELAP